MNYCLHCMSPLSGDGPCPACGAEGAPHADAHQLLPGTLLADKYLVGRVLGEGGFGITYIGRDTRLDMKVAIKEYYPNGYSHRNHAVSSQVTLSKSESDDFYANGLERFLREARALGKFCGEPGVVGVRDFFEENGTAYIVMEYLDGITLKEYLSRNGPIPANTLFSLMEPVLTVLEKIHAQDLIHRDISPDNIMLLKSGQLKLLDFGAAREVTGEKSLSVMLKPGYAPEEQYRTRGKQGPWTDVYALCATIYKCLTGITPEESLQRVMEDDLKAPSTLGISIAPHQEQALLKGLQVRGADRWQTVAALAEALREDDRTIHAVEVSTEPKTVYEPAAAPVPQPKVEKTVAETPSSGSQVEEKKKDPSLPDPKVEYLKSIHKRKVEETPAPRVNSKPAVEQTPSKPQKSHAKGGEKFKFTFLQKKVGKLPLWLFLVALAILIPCLFMSGIIQRFFAPREEITGTSGNDGYVLTVKGRAEDPNRQLDLAVPPASLGADLDYSEITSFGQGLWVAESTTGGQLTYSLLSNEFVDPLIEGAALIRWPIYQDEEESLLSTQRTGCRYLQVYYAESVTENEDEALLWQTENGIYTSSVTDSLTMYTGYYRVYDLETLSFVPDAGNPGSFLEFSLGTDSLYICGDSFCVYDGAYIYPYDSDDHVSLFNAQGQRLLHMEGTVIRGDGAGDGFVIIDVDGTDRVYDEQGNQIYASNTVLSVAGNYSPYIYAYADDGINHRLLTPDGQEVIPGTEFYSIRDVYGDVMEVRENDRSGLVNLDGTWLVPRQYDYIVHLGSGYFYAYRPYVGYTLISPEGIIATGLDTAPTDLRVSDGDRFLMINSHTYDTLPTDGRWVSTLTMGLICVEDPITGLLGVYDLFTGQLLLPYEYEAIEYHNSLLYAYKNSQWEIYDLAFSTDISQ